MHCGIVVNVEQEHLNADVICQEGCWNQWHSLCFSSGQLNVTLSLLLGDSLSMTSLWKGVGDSGTLSLLCSWQWGGFLFCQSGFCCLPVLLPLCFFPLLVPQVLQSCAMMPRPVLESQLEILTLSHSWSTELRRQTPVCGFTNYCLWANSYKQVELTLGSG